MPAEFSMHSITSSSSVHNFLVPFLVQLTVMALGMVKSLPRMMGLLCVLHMINELENVESLIRKSQVVIP